MKKEKTTSSWNDAIEWIDHIGSAFNVSSVHINKAINTRRTLFNNNEYLWKIKVNFK